MMYNMYDSVKEIMERFEELYYFYPDERIEKGNVSIDTFEFKKHSIATMNGYCTKGKFKRLIIDEQVMMSNTFMERETNVRFLNRAEGDILIGGLGLGMLPFSLAIKDEVKSITIIENNRDLIELVKENAIINKKINIIEGDIFTYTPDRKYDYIWLDIWYSVTDSIFEDEVTPLMEKYANYTDNVDYWCREMREIESEHGCDWSVVADSIYFEGIINYKGKFDRIEAVENQLKKGALK